MEFQREPSFHPPVPCLQESLAFLVHAKVLPQIPHLAKHYESNLFKWCGLAQCSFFLSTRVWPSGLEFVFLLLPQLPDS